MKRLFFVLRLAGFVGVTCQLANLATAQPRGVYHLLANGHRLRLDLGPTAASSLLTEEGTGTVQHLGNQTWDATTNFLEFRRDVGNVFQWYRLSVVQGVAAGRFAESTSSTKPPLRQFLFHVRGWNQSVIDATDVPRTWDVSIAGTGGSFGGVLRIDRDANGVLVGQMKVFSLNGALAEEPESELSAISWNNTTLSFVRTGPFGQQQFSGSVSAAPSRLIAGNWTAPGFTGKWSGQRSQVLGFGLGSQAQALSSWQARFRRQVLNLTEGFRLINTNIPVPCSVNLCPATSVAVSSAAPYVSRDDGSPPPPPNYIVKQTTLTWFPGSRFDPANPPPQRQVRVLLATPPMSKKPPKGWPLIIAVNGHGETAAGLLFPNSSQWYGDSAARRGFMVLAVDIRHRSDKLYAGCDNGCPYSSIRGQGYATSDWEEDGERAFDVRRALDWAMANNVINPNQIVIFGLSLGGEVATITAALDPRIKMAVVSGYSPDMHVMDVNGNHPCYRWFNGLSANTSQGNVAHEFLDVSDYEAAIAPRRLIVETGASDFVFSRATPPWQGDKQVTRRARAAYGAAASNLVHVLHGARSDVLPHAFRVGGKASSTACSGPPNCASTLTDPEMLRVFLVTQPSTPSDWQWQTSSVTRVGAGDIYLDIAANLPP